MNKRTYTLNVKCPKCGEWMKLSPVDDYPLYCNHCEEDFYSIEIHEILGDFFEVTIDIGYDEYKMMLEAIKETFKDACFIGYDDFMEVCDIGFENIPDSKRVKDIIKFFNLVEM